MRSRTGKIARLPHEIREALNTRLRDGQPAQEIISWLNQRPETQLPNEDGSPSESINDVNLTNWRNGGYQDWLENKLAYETLKEVAAKAAEIRDQVKDDLAEGLSTLLMAKIAAAIKSLERHSADPVEQVRALTEISLQLTAIRRAGQHGKALALNERRVKIAEQRQKNRTTQIPTAPGELLLARDCGAITPAMLVEIEKVMGGGRSPYINEESTLAIQEMAQNL